MSHQETLFDTPNATSSPALGDGLSRSEWRAGRTLAPYGPARAHANRSARQALDVGLMTRATYGRSGDGSLTNVDLSPSLANRLRARMDVRGSLEFVLTWTYWDMPSGPPIYALLASGRPTSGSGFGGWPTPRVSAARTSASAMDRQDSMSALSIEQVAEVAAGVVPREIARLRPEMRERLGFAGWPTPTRQDSASSGAAGYSTESGRHPGTTLTDAARFAGYPTPGANDGKGAQELAQRRGQLREAMFGSPAPMEKRGALNPALSRWLMGYPAAWDSCGATAMQSFRKSRRSS